MPAPRRPVRLFRFSRAGRSDDYHRRQSALLSGQADRSGHDVANRHGGGRLRPGRDVRTAMLSLDVSQTGRGPMSGQAPPADKMEQCRDAIP
ncbi:hypothetical protein MTBSS4_200020 [Magnetospirillum sp. SS-4]|nr:hypothetical protein MTBSS4_200020 [Magnetospirillum sp. SS-4]